MTGAKSTGQQRPEHRPVGTGGTLRQRLLRRKNRSEIGVCTKYTLFFENFLMFVNMGQSKFYYSLAIFLLLEVGLTVCFFLAYYLPDVRNVIFPDNLFRQAIVSYRDDNDMRDLIDNIQSSLGCCGQTDSEKGYEDWNQNPYFNCSLQNESPERCSVPPSCCRILPGSNINLLCGANIYTLAKDGQMTLGDTSKIYTDGCLKALRVWVDSNMLILGGVMAGILVPQEPPGYDPCSERQMATLIHAAAEAIVTAIGDPLLPAGHVFVPLCLRSRLVEEKLQEYLWCTTPAAQRNSEKFHREAARVGETRHQINMANGPPRRRVDLVWQLAGIAMLVVSTYVLVQKEKKITYFVEFIFDPSCLLCLAGSITVVVAFLGCGGALRENTGFLRAYYWILSILLLAQVIIIIFVFIFYFMDDVAKKLNFYPENVLRDAIIRYRDDVDMRNFIDDLQQFLGCCGVSNKDDGFLDWNENSYFNCTGGSPDEYSEKCSVPHSCCIMKPGENINYQCGNNALTKDASDAKSTIYTRGCLMAIKVLITDNAWIIGGIVIGILIPQHFCDDIIPFDSFF
ncbi:hypothetical protein C0Q70_09903 [Pomacea canaliculata]|uniref:Uncharacterized protein n=1 Tax=Pomacea canaliculata TaxID=400727 RepID=A0A2T7PB32_POMCA|nr:hypothetical protein C0Q70_09903 [Pomacea canaliculata]